MCRSVTSLRIFWLAVLLLAVLLLPGCQQSEQQERQEEQRITREEARVALLEMLPSPSMLLGKDRNDNPFLYYNKWNRFKPEPEGGTERLQC